MLRFERQCNRLHGRAASPAHHEFITAVTAVNYYKWIPQFQSSIHHLCNSSAADLLGSVEDGWVSWTMSHYFQRLNLTNFKLRFASTLSSTNFDILSPTVHSSSTAPSHFEFWFLSDYLIIEGSCVRVAGCRPICQICYRSSTMSCRRFCSPSDPDNKFFKL